MKWDEINGHDALLQANATTPCNPSLPLALFATNWIDDACKSSETNQLSA